MIKKEVRLSILNLFEKKLNLFLGLTIFFFSLFSFQIKGNAQCAVVANAGTDRTVCQGSNTTLTATASGGTAPYYYRWSSSTAGLNYAYYTGTWSTLPNFASLTPVSTGTVNNFNISSIPSSNYYAAKFWGHINISVANTYTFYAQSGDGSKLYIDGILIVNNDGVHDLTEKSGAVNLTAGVHFIEVQYFHRGDDDDKGLNVRYASSGISKQTIPNGILSTAGTLSSSNKVFPNTSGTYTITVTDSKGCTATDAMNITVPGSTANAGTDIYQCNNANFILDATPPSVGSGIWSVLSGVGTVTAPTSPTSTVTGVPAGTTTSLIWTITASGCPATDTVLMVNNLATSPACDCGSVFSVSGTTSTFSRNQLRPLNITTGQYGAQFGTNLSVETAAISWDTLHKKMYYAENILTTSPIPIYAMNSSGSSVNTGASLPGFSVAENYNRAGYNPIDQKSYFISSYGTKWVSYEPNADGLGGTVSTISPITYYPSTAPTINSSNGGGDFVFDYRGNGYVITNTGHFYKALFNSSGGVTVVYLGKLTLPMSQITAIAFGSDNKCYVSGNNGTSGSNPTTDVYYIDLETLATTKVNSVAAAGTSDYMSCNFPFYDPLLIPTKSYTKVSGFPSTSITSGDVIEYRIVVKNEGNISSGNIKLMDTIPANTTYVLGSTKINNTTVPDVSSKTRFAVAGGDFINSTTQTLYNGVISPGDSAVITFRVRVTQCGTVTNIAKITSGYFNEEAQSNIVTFEAISLPAPLISVSETSCTSNDKMVTSGSSVSLTASGGLFYSWNNGLGSGSSKTVTPATTTTYTVTVTSITLCVSTASTTIFVVDAPTETVTATESSCTPNDDRVIGGGTVNLTASAASGTNAYFSIIPAHSSKNIEVSGSSTSAGADIVQRTATSTNNQRWVFISTTTGKPVSTITNGRYYIQNVGSKLFLYPRNNASVETTPIEQNVVNGLSTQWDVTDVGSGQFSITNSYNSLGLEIANASVADAAVLQFAAYTGASHQRFNLTANSGYTYSWNNGLGTGATKATAPTATTTYTATVTDLMGCTAAANKSIAVVAAPTIVMTATENSCTANDDKILNGASVNLTVSGGTSYSWDNGLGTGTSKTVTPSGTTTYTVTATDANGCTNTVSKTITVAPSPTASMTATETSCTPNDDLIVSGGSANLTASGSGGGGGFSYVWSNGLGTGVGPKNVSPTSTTLYSVTATDANGCTATASKSITVASASTATISATESSCTTNDDRVLSGGSVNLIASGGTSYAWNNSLGTGASKTVTPAVSTTYTVTATDANGCTSTANKTITVVAAPSATVTATETSCTSNDDRVLGGASVSLTANGGTSYAWDNSLGTGASKTVTPSVSTTYIVTATDANGCTATANKTITIISSPTASIAAAETSCSPNDDKIITGATVNLTASGGASYAWNNSLGAGATKSPTPTSTTTYTVTATDANGCMATANKIITVAAGLSLSHTATNILCNGASTGAINLTVSGGTTPYTYNWNGGVTSEDRTGLAVGSYSVTVTDASGCSQNTTITLTQPTVLSLATTPTHIACNAASTGAIATTVSGGVAPYSYSWSDGATTQNRTGLAAGTYGLTVTDNNGCTKTSSETLSQPSALSLSTSVTNIICGVGTGAINLTVLGGTTPYTYNWGGGVTTEDRTGLTGGTYSVIVTDDNGCTATTSSAVTVSSPATLSTSVTNIACFGINTGAINLTASGGSPFTFNWGGGVTSEDRTGLAAGIYSVTVTNAQGCISSTSATVTTPSVLAVSANTTNVNCNGGSTGAIDITVTGGTLPYTYNWGGGVTTEDRTGLTIGNYTVTVTDGNICNVILAITITQPTVLNLSTVVTQVTCVGGTDGAIDLTVTGGTSPYTYNWGGGVTTQDRTSLGAGTYSVTVTDNNGCTAVTGATLTPQNGAPNPPTGLRH